MEGIGEYEEWESLSVVGLRGGLGLCPTASSGAAGLLPQRKMQKINAVVAHIALAHKLARAAYYVMRDQVPFDPEKLFR